MRRVITLSLLLAFASESTGCYAWHQDPSPIPRLQNAKPSDVFRVTLASGRVVDLTDVRVRADSVLATQDSITIVRGEIKRTAVPIGFPVTQIAATEHRSVNGGGIALGIGLAVVVLGGLLGIYASSHHF